MDRLNLIDLNFMNSMPEVLEGILIHKMLYLELSNNTEL